jgi:hypothetical protein
MNARNLDRLGDAGILSRIGGAGQGGSAKPKEEREALDRQHHLEPEQTPLAREERKDTPAKPGDEESAKDSGDTPPVSRNG